MKFNNTQVSITSYIFVILCILVFEKLIFFIVSVHRSQLVKKEKVGQSSRKKMRRGETSNVVENSFQIYKEDARDPLDLNRNEKVSQEVQNAQIFKFHINEDFDKNAANFKEMLENDIPKLDISELLNFNHEDFNFSHDDLKKIDDTTKEAVDIKSDKVTEKYPVLIGKHIFYLNKSRSKWIEVGLRIPNFNPVVYLGGLRTNGLLLSFEEYSTLISKKEELMKNLAGTSSFCISFMNKIIQTEFINNSRVVKICSLKDNVVFEQIYFAISTLTELFKYETTVNMFFKFFNQLNFKDWFETVSKELSVNTEIVLGDEQVNAYALLMTELSVHNFKLLHC